MSLNVYYLSGWIRSNKMWDNINEWFYGWLSSAMKAEHHDSELVVFRIPKDTTGMANVDAIVEIEQLLQSKFGIPKMEQISFSELVKKAGRKLGPSDEEIKECFSKYKT